MRITFRTFQDGVNLAVAQIKKEPFFYIFSILIMMVVGGVVGFIFSFIRQFMVMGVSSCGGNQALLVGSIIGSQILYYLIVYWLTFTLSIGMFKCIKRSVSGEKPLVWMVIAEYKNILSYFIPALLYTVVITLIGLIVMLPAFALIPLGRGNGSEMAGIGTLLLFIGVLIVIFFLIIAIALYLAPIFALLTYDIAEGRINPSRLNEVGGVFKTFSLPMMLLMLLSSLLASIGVIACCIGVLVTAPAGMIISWHLCRVFRGDDAVTPSQSQEESKPVETI